MPQACAMPSRMAKRIRSARDSMPSFFMMRSWWPSMVFGLRESALPISTRDWPLPMCRSTSISRDVRRSIELMIRCSGAAARRERRHVGEHREAERARHLGSTPLVGPRREHDHDSEEEHRS